jgi:hypothetical protein
MSKPTENQPPAESGADAIPPQQAKNLYTAHARACRRCQDLDRDRCSDGQRLWRGWEGACERAYQQLAREMP